MGPSRDRTSGLLLRMLNVLLLLSCSSTGGYNSASVATAQAEDPKNGTPSASALRSGAETALSKGEHEKALRLFTQVIELEPKNERNFYKRFRVYLSKRKYAEAISDLSRALELKPKYKQALAQRAKLLKMMGQCEEAVRDYDALGVMDPGHEDLKGSLPEEAENCRDRLAEVKVALGRKDLHRAIALYDMILDGSSDGNGSGGGGMHNSDTFGAEILLSRARCHFQLGRWHESVADSGRAAKLAEGGSKEAEEALELRGRSFLALGDFEMASNHFRQVLLDNPDNDACREGHRRCRVVVKKLEAAEARVAEGDVAGATERWREATTMEPDNPLFVGPVLRKVRAA
ncbi:unnamed protein product, partial [Choristocarpus tenellus]